MRSRETHIKFPCYHLRSHVKHMQTHMWNMKNFHVKPMRSRETHVNSHVKHMSNFHVKHEIICEAQVKFPWNTCKLVCKSCLWGLYLHLKMKTLSFTHPVVFCGTIKKIFWEMFLSMHWKSMSSTVDVLQNVICVAKNKKKVIQIWNKHNFWIDDPFKIAALSV